MSGPMLSSPLTRRSNLLLHWRASDGLKALTGQEAVFTRASQARGHGNNGVVTYQPNEPRYHQLRGETYLLLEAAQTNEKPSSLDMDVYAHVTTVAGQLAPDGSTNATLVLETVASDNHYGFWSITGLPDTPHHNAFSIYVKPHGRTKGLMYFGNNANPSGMTFDLEAMTTAAFSAEPFIRAVEDVGNGWYRLVMSCPATEVSGTVYLLFANDAGATTYAGSTNRGMYVWGAQHTKLAAAVGSYIPTAGTAVTRAADNMYFPFTHPPQEMTVYTRFRERAYSGKVAGGAFSADPVRLWQVCNAAGSTPFFTGYASLTGWAAYVHDGATDVGAVSGGHPLYNDEVEVSLSLHSPGAVGHQYCINNGAVTAMDTSLHNSRIPAAWSGERFYLGSNGGGLYSYGLYHSVKVAAGVHTLEAMRGMY
jgi:hypothetical protein